MFRRLTRINVALSLVLIVGCAEQAPVVPTSPRAIKTIEIGERAGEQVRIIAGTTEADTVTELAFEVGGRLVELDAGLGDSVAAGAVIGVLDDEPYRLAAISARGQLDQAEARVVEIESQFERIEDIYSKGYVSKAEFDTALANLESARANVRIMKTQHELALRDLERTQLISPIDGTITVKYVETYTDVKAGQAVVQISALGRLKVNASVPETLLRDLSVGDAVAVSFPDRDSPPTPGKITEIGARAANTNTFPVVVMLDQPVVDLPAGAAAEVTFSFATAATGEAFMLPITAVLPTGQDRTGTIFVYDPDGRRVQARAVEILDVEGNRLEVSGQIDTGDIVAAAGVPFLHDGMEVRLMSGGS